MAGPTSFAQPWEMAMPAAVARTRDIMDAIRAEMDESGAVTVVHSFDEMMAAREAGKFYVFIGIEGLAAIGEDLGRRWGRRRSSPHPRRTSR